MGFADRELNIVSMCVSNNALHLIHAADSRGLNNRLHKLSQSVLIPSKIINHMKE